MTETHQPPTFGRAKTDARSPHEPCRAGQGSNRDGPNKKKLSIVNAGGNQGSTRCDAMNDHPSRTDASTEPGAMTRAEGSLSNGRPDECHKAVPRNDDPQGTEGADGSDQDPSYGRADRSLENLLDSTGRSPFLNDGLSYADGTTPKC